MGKKSKKKKGGATKAKTATAAADTERSEISAIAAVNIIDTMCKHGLDCSQLTLESDVSKFSLSFFNRKTFSVAEHFMDHFDEFIGVWNNDKQRQLAIDVMLRQGTNLIIGASGENYSFDFQLAKECAIAVLLLEEHDGKGMDLTLTCCTLENAVKVANLCSYREVLSFYKKRISCECLKEKYKQVKKKQPTKLGCCWNCRKHVDRSTLMACSSCKVTLYCSRKCQKEHWSAFGGHKEECSQMVEDQKMAKFRKATSNLEEKMNTAEDTEDKKAVIAELIEALENSPDSIKNMTMADLFKIDAANR